MNCSSKVKYKLTFEGLFEGATGLLVGAWVGLLVGAWVGLLVGAWVGFFVGAWVGFFVGDWVGPFVGMLVCLTGAPVGLPVIAKSR